MTCPAYRYHPATVAQAFASLAILNPRTGVSGAGHRRAAQQTSRRRHVRQLPRRRRDRLIRGHRTDPPAGAVADSFTGHYFRTDELQTLRHAERCRRRCCRRERPPEPPTGRRPIQWIWIAQTALSTTPNCSPRSRGALSGGRDPPPWVSGPNCSRRRRRRAAARAADLWRFTAGADRPAQSGRDPACRRVEPDRKVLANWAVGTDPGVHIGAVQAVLDRHFVPFCISPGLTFDHRHRLLPHQRPARTALEAARPAPRW